ncbi:MAG TPA: DUF1015 domain-containing protein, partial [Bryobacteraceae bacterium]|nr:DUF1015 domain-containing protein [Bryobacteraceae bacterium]
MARIYPFQPYRYTAAAGPLQDVVTQPYDKISPEMQSGYLAKSPNNLVRVILGERKASDSDTDNVYTRATSELDRWIANGILAQDPEPGIYPYFQEFTVPDTGEHLVRKGFIALGGLEDYSANVVHRHELTLAGPKKDRLELLRHTRAHCELLFMLYPDRDGAIDAILDQAAAAPPLGEVTDEYGAIHRIWKITGGERIAELMADKKLLIADGHHRYETALAYRAENPNLPGADRVPMAFVNMHSDGLRILAAHRLVNGLPAENFPTDFLRTVADDFIVKEIDSLAPLQKTWSEDTTGCTIIGAAIGSKLYMLQERDARNELDLRILHEEILAKTLGISAEAVRDEKFLRYVRGIDKA